jgi:hypothetical protein
LLPIARRCRRLHGLPDPPGSLALGASRRINPAAGLRRLFDRRKAGAPAGNAFALDLVGLGPFHFRSQIRFNRFAEITDRAALSQGFRNRQQRRIFTLD